MGISALHPGLLIAGIVCIAIPILVHLLRRKHRPISWGAMRFLEQAYKKRRRLITLEQLLLLLTRCAIIALIAGGVGALIIGSGSIDQRPRTLVLILDNSIHSAALIDGTGSALQYQQKRALELLADLDSSRGDQAALITTAGPAQGVAVPPTTELGLIRSRVQSLAATDADRDLQGSMDLLSTVAQSNETLSVIIPALLMAPSGWDSESGSMQATSLDQLDSLESVLLDVPATTPRSNFAIVNASPLRPIVTRFADQDAANDEIHGVRVTLKRSGDLNSETTIMLSCTDAITDKALRSESLVWPSGQSVMTRSISIDPSVLTAARGGSALVRITIQGASEDSNPRDNTRMVGLPLRQQIRIGIIDAFTSSNQDGIRPSRWVRAVLSADDALIDIQQINASAAADRIDPTLDMLILLTPSAIDDRAWSRIARLSARPSGPLPIIITPDADAGSQDWIEQLRTIAPELVQNPVMTKSFDPATGLANSLEENGLLSGIADEYLDLASSVTITRSMVFEPGSDASVLLRNSDSEPIAVSSSASAPDELAMRGQVVILGFALDARWTDLPARPMFVAMMHEMVRSMLSRSIAPDQRISGLDAVSLNFTTLETLLTDRSDPDPRLSGAYAMIDQQGTTQRAVVLNPDSTRTVLDSSRLVSAESVLSQIFDPSTLFDASAESEISLNAHSALQNNGRSIALILFGIAALLAVIEVLLARRCSYSAINPLSQAGGAM